MTAANTLPSFDCSNDTEQHSYPNNGHTNGHEQKHQEIYLCHTRRHTAGCATRGLRVYVTGPYADEVKTIEFDSKKQAGVRITPERGFHVRPFGGYGYIKTKKHVTASGTFWQAAVVPDELSKVSGSGKIVHLSNVEYIRINGDKTYSLIEAFKSGSNENDIIAAGKITILTITCNNKP